MLDIGSFGAGRAAASRGTGGVPDSVREAERLANEQLARANELEAAIHNRWIPYAVTLRASLIAKRADRAVLIDALRKLDPANVDAISKQADEASDAEYAAVTTPGAKVGEVHRTVMTESDARRLNK